MRRKKDKDNSSDSLVDVDGAVLGDSSGKKKANFDIDRDLTDDPGLYCFVSLAQFHGLPADPEQISHALAIDPKIGMSEGDMLRAARSFKLKARAATVKITQLQKLPTPLIVALKKEKFAVLAQIQGDKLLILMPDGSPPTVLTKAQFERKWTGRVVLMTPRFWKEADRKFNLKWFIPTIVKYKKPLLQVLLAAFVVQIIGILRRF